MGEGESRMVGMEMKDRLRLKPKRNVVWSRFRTWRVAKESMVDR